MPVRWIVDLPDSAELPDSRDDGYYDDLHRAACRFFEADGADHGAEDKPFAIRLTRPGDSGHVASVSYTWIADGSPPRPIVPTTIKLGGVGIPVTINRTITVSYQRLEHRPTLRRVTLAVSTPAKFRHNHRDYPLPDPYITFSSLGRGYLAHRRSSTMTVDGIRELARTVVVYTHDVHTEPFTWHGRTSAGFVGRVEFGIPRTADRAMWRLFTTLCSFAAFSGLGHGTTHGLGATDLCPEAEPSS